MNQISPYYSWYIKGSIASNSNLPDRIKFAAECFENSLKYLKTEDAYRSLMVCYAKLQDDDNYMGTLERAVCDGFSIFYSTFGLFYADNPIYFDKEKSLYWFEKGIKEGNVKSYCDLANHYMAGCKAFKKNEKKGISLLLKALELNDPQYNGYICWAIGKYCYDKEEYEVAFNHFYKAFDCGYKKASYNLALMYRDGLGVKKDINEYINYLLKDLSPESALELGGIYNTGLYTQVDHYLAFTYFDYAAKSGNPIGAIMAAGYIVQRKDYNEAVLNKYLEIAFRNGANDQNMKDHYQDIEDTLGKDVKDKLQELAAKYWNINKSLA